MKKYFKRSYGDRGFVIVTIKGRHHVSIVECEVVFLYDKDDLTKTHYVGATIWPNIKALIPMTYEEVMLEIL